MNLARDLLFNDRAKLNNETLEKLAFLNNTSVNRSSHPIHDNARMAPIAEMNSTGQFDVFLLISVVTDYFLIIFFCH